MAEPPDDIPDALITVELERIGASQAFRRSPLQVKLLRYLVDKARAGEGQRLKQSVLAVEVIGREASRFDASADTSIRVTMRRLRQRLARYYADEGAWAAVEIELPVGTYCPVLRRRTLDGAPKLPSIAVLPLRNFTGDAALDAFCDGLAEEITDALAQVPGIKIVARTSAFRFRDASEDVRAIGSALGVATLLEGSVQRGTDGLAMTAQWVRAVDGYHAWSCTFAARAGEDDEAFKTRVARDIVGGLHRRLLQDGPIPRRATTLPLLRRSRVADAQSRYNEGRYLMRTQSAEGYRRAAEPLREAIAIDPAFALAHCALACTLINVIGMTLAPSGEMLDEARAALERALALDPELGEAHAVHGFVANAFDRDWAGAERAHLRGIRFAPSLCYAHSSYAWGLMVNGRFADADAEYRFARELDPLDMKMRAHHALVALYAGDDAHAIRDLGALIELEPSHVIARVLLATAYLWRCDLETARLHFEELARAYPGFTIGEVGLAQVDAESGRRRAARARLARLTSGHGQTHLPPYQVAMVHSRLGDVPEAIAWLERAARERDMNFVCAPVDRTFARLRDDARFVALLERHGLRAVWRDTHQPNAVS
jgi:TolB-like protein/Tfp pilus assembly protein PilF